MLLAEVVVMGVIFYISGVRGQNKTICALKGSSVELLCSRLNTAVKWGIVHKNGSQAVAQEELEKKNGNRVTFHTSGRGQPALTINNLTETDANIYCCTNNPGLCRKNQIHLTVSGDSHHRQDQTVTLMCSTSCALTESYIWYRNREFLYEDWSPWYQELVSSEEGVTYSCAIKGHEHLRAPDVSVDSITPTCFSVTYSQGRICSSRQKPEDEPCSITYPREIRVQSPSASAATLTCITSCPVSDRHTSFSWYQNRRLQNNSEKQHFSVSGPSNSSFSCAVKDFEHLLSPEVCAEDKNCQTVNYPTRRICAVEGSSVNISSDYSYPDNMTVDSKGWLIRRRSGERAERMSQVPGRVDYHDNNKNEHILRIHNLKRQGDSGEFLFSLQKDLRDWESSDLPGVTLVVTGLRVRFTPSTVVTEGQRVTLTCGTSCPLSGDTSYIWSFNGQPLPQSRIKHLVLDPVSSQHAGSYSCAVRVGPKNISSDEKTLTVLVITGEQMLTPSALAGFSAALLVLIIFNVSCWILKNRSSTQSQQRETSENMEQLNSDENISAPPQQDDHHYSRLLFSKNQTEDQYSTIKPASSD
ncbi:hypothetical protein Q5P01_025568 [Channa striata]|uniref:Ig-like domain-containing protein n=1 Tax=Channa striata TaxID=64152 RepID=A0AA88IIS7_CHASR|nr:hypothetical protein Q5P01_025568 [Channa striata]